MPRSIHRAEILPEPPERQTVHRHRCRQGQHDVGTLPEDSQELEGLLGLTDLERAIVVFVEVLVEDLSVHASEDFKA